MGEQCVYRLDPEAWEAEYDKKSPLEDIYKCHREATHDDFCIFHAPLNSKDTDAVRDALIEAIDSPGKKEKQFVGASFGHLDLRFTQIDAPDGYPIDLTHVELFGHLNLSWAEIHQHWRTDGAVFRGPYIAVHTRFYADLYGVGAIVQAPMVFDGIVAQGVVHFDRMKVDVEASFQGATFVRDLVFTDAQLGVVKLDGTNLASDLVFDDAFGKRITLPRAKIGGRTQFKNATFLEALFGAVRFDICDFSNATIMTADFSGAVFESVAYLRESEFKNANFSGVIFEQDALFDGCIIQNQGRFINVTFDDWASFTRLISLGDCIFDNTDFEGDVRFSESIFLGQISFRQARVQGRAELTNVCFQSTPVFAESTFTDLLMSGVRPIEQSDFPTELLDAIEIPSNFPATLSVDLHEATILDGVISQDGHEEVVYNLAGATVGDIGLQTSGSEPLFDYFLILDTTFDGFDFAQPSYREALVECEWRLENTVTNHQEFWPKNPLDTSEFERFFDSGDYNPLDINSSGDDTRDEINEGGASNTANENEGKVTEPTKKSGDDGEEQDFDGYTDGQWRYQSAVNPTVLETTYLKAKNGADDEGEQKAASEFFIWELRHRRTVHKEQLVSASMWPTKLKAGWRLLANFFMYISSGYGERPSWVLWNAVGTIVLFGFLFWWLMAAPPYGTEAGYFILSSQAFITLVLSGAPPVDQTIVRGFAQLEGFMGGFYIALFVFCLTRSIHR